MDPTTIVLIISQVLGLGLRLFDGSRMRQLQAQQNEANRKRIATDAVFSLEQSRQRQYEAWEHQKELASQSHQRALDLIDHMFAGALTDREKAKVLEVWPLAVLPHQVIQFAGSFKDMMPLSVLIAPIRCVGSASNGWSDTLAQRILEERLGDFLNRYFPFQSGSPRPVQFLGNSWKEGGVRREAAITALFESLKGHPTVLLDGEILLGELHLGVGQWADSDIPTFIRLPIHRISVAATSMNMVIDEIALLYKLIILAAADQHFLIVHELQPQLPKALAELLKDSPEIAGGSTWRALASQYGSLYQRLSIQKPGWQPEFELDLADSLSALPDKALAWERVNTSMRVWLDLRNHSDPLPSDLFRAILAIRKPRSDETYVQRLKEVRTRLARMTVTRTH
jgi:hypothetical protein